MPKAELSSPYTDNCLLGMRVLFNPNIPFSQCVSLPSNIGTEQHNTEFNTWLRCIFGEYQPTYVLANNTIVMGSRAQLELLKKAAGHDSFKRMDEH